MREAHFCRTCEFRLPYCVRSDREFCGEQCRGWWYLHPGQKRLDFAPGEARPRRRINCGQPKTLAEALRTLAEVRAHAAQLEAAARFPHVTSALADLKGITLSYDAEKHNGGSKGVNQDVVALAQRFAMLMSEYNSAISDGRITVNEAKRMLRETLAIQQVLLEMKLNLEDEVS